MPTFINGYDDARTGIVIDLQPGTYYFTLFGESAFTPVPADVNFVANLYFNNYQSGSRNLRALRSGVLARVRGRELQRPRHHRQRVPA